LGRHYTYQESSATHNSCFLNPPDIAALYVTVACEEAFISARTHPNFQIQSSVSREVALKLDQEFVETLGVLIEHDRVFF
jgi:hypothetical protein